MTPSKRVGKPFFLCQAWGALQQPDCHNPAYIKSDTVKLARFRGNILAPTRRISGARLSSWYALGAASTTYLKSSKSPAKRLAIGSSRTISMRAAEATA
jgi:hypothetical protein